MLMHAMLGLEDTEVVGEDTVKHDGRKHYRGDFYRGTVLYAILWTK